MTKRGESSRSGKKEKQKKTLPSQALPLMVESQLLMKRESEGPYKPLYDALDRLDNEYPVVVENHGRYDSGVEPVEYAAANLLFSTHAAYMYPQEPLYGRGDMLQSVKMISLVPGGTVAIMGLLYNRFPQAVICMEHLYFLQRHISRLIGLPDSERPKELQGQSPEDWLFPQGKIEELRLLAAELWRNETEVNDVAETKSEG